MTAHTTKIRDAYDLLIGFVTSESFEREFMRCNSELFMNASGFILDVNSGNHVAMVAITVDFRPLMPTPETEEKVH